MHRHHSEPRFNREIRRGVREALPLFIPAVPFALVLGVVINASGASPFLGWSSSWIIYGGAAQIALLQLLGEGASVAAAVTAALIIGARHLLYSATLAPRFSDQPRWFRWFGPYLMVDQVFAMSVVYPEGNPVGFRHYYVGIGLTFWSLWLLFTAIGMVAGPLVPPGWQLAFAAPVLFASLLVLGIDRYPKALSALVAAGVSLLCADLPNRSGLLVGALAGIAAGLLADALRRSAR